MPANVDHSYIIKAPLLSEKITWGLNEQKRYAFLVDPRATKTEIKEAIQAIYKVRVTGVNTQLRKGKNRRMRYGVTTESLSKKATISLHKDDSIELF